MQAIKNIHYIRDHCFTLIFNHSSTTKNALTRTRSMASPSHALLFPHEHTDMLGALHDLSVRSKTRPRLRTFLAASSTVVHEQIVDVDRSERASIGPFEDLVELAERHLSRQRHNVVAEMVLLTTIQISQLLVYVRTSRERSGLS